MIGYVLNDRYRILSKLGVQSRTQAAAMAHRLHLT